MRKDSLGKGLKSKRQQRGGKNRGRRGGGGGERRMCETKEKERKEEMKVRREEKPRSSVEMSTFSSYFIYTFVFQPVFSRCL